MRLLSLGPLASCRHDLIASPDFPHGPFRVVLIHDRAIEFLHGNSRITTYRHPMATFTDAAAGFFRSERLRQISRLFLAVFFIVAGANHFISPGTYLPLMPDYLPWHLPLIYLSGVAEIIGGIGICFSAWRRLAGWWLIAVLVAIFPSNIHMLMNDVPLGGVAVPIWVYWIRLPLQGFLIAWIYWACVRGTPQR